MACNFGDSKLRERKAAYHSTLATLLCLSLSFFTLTSCVSARINSFGKIQNGMEKDQVLEVAGSPNVTRRVQGQDSWTYIYKDRSSATEVREVVFDSGKVVYVGPKRTPKISPEEQDRINEEANLAEAARLEAEEEERSRELGIARVKKKKADRIDRKIHNEIYGTADSPELEAKKRAPVFEPIN